LFVDQNSKSNSFRDTHYFKDPLSKIQIFPTEVPGRNR
jgi:hypothetical protein